MENFRAPKRETGAFGAAKGPETPGNTPHEREGNEERSRAEKQQSRREAEEKRSRAAADEKQRRREAEEKQRAGAAKEKQRRGVEKQGLGERMAQNAPM